jgi:hypothetical protein
VAWSPEKRRQFLRDLNEVEKGIGTFYKYFLYVLVIGVTLFGVYLYKSFDKANRPFLEGYFGILYLLFLLWVGAQLFGLRRRLNSNASGLDRQGSFPKLDMKFDRDPGTGARKFSFQFGTPSASSKTAKFNFGFNLSSVAEEDKLDDLALAQAESYLETGTSLDMICRLLNPRYSDWSPPKQEVYQAYVNGAVELWKAKNPQFSDSPPPQQAAPAAPEQAVPSPMPTASVPDGFDSDVRKSWLTPAQMTVIVIIAGIVLGALVTTFWLSRSLNQ